MKYFDKKFKSKKSLDGRYANKLINHTLFCGIDVANGISEMATNINGNICYNTTTDTLRVNVEEGRWEHVAKVNDFFASGSTISISSKPSSITNKEEDVLLEMNTPEMYGQKYYKKNIGLFGYVSSQIIGSTFRGISTMPINST